MFSFHIFLSWPAPERSRTMCLWLSDLGEPENEGYTVCCGILCILAPKCSIDCMHSYCACMFFQVMDFFMVFFAIAVYFGVNTVDLLSSPNHFSVHGELEQLGVLRARHRALRLARCLPHRSSRSSSGEDSTTQHLSMATSLHRPLVHRLDVRHHLHSSLSSSLLNIHREPCGHSPSGPSGSSRRSSTSSVNGMEKAGKRRGQGDGRGARLHQGALQARLLPLSHVLRGYDDFAPPAADSNDAQIAAMQKNEGDV